MQVEFPCVEDTGSHPPRLLQMPRIESTTSSLGSNTRKERYSTLCHDDGKGKGLENPHARVINGPRRTSLQLTGDPGLYPASPFSCTQDGK